MRIALLTIGFALLLATRADAACVPAIKWGGDWYLAHQARAPLGEKLTKQAIVPACNDTGGNAPDTMTDVHRMKGVDPHVAVLTRKNVWVNGSTFPALEDHPLHARLGYDEREPARRQGKRCTITGKVDSTLATFVLEKPHRFVTVDAATKISLRRHGVAWIDEGKTIRVRGRCNGDRVLADRIDRA